MLVFIMIGLYVGLAISTILYYLKLERLKKAPKRKPVRHTKKNKSKSKTDNNKE